MTSLRNLLFFGLTMLLLHSCGMGGWRVVDGAEFTVEFPGEPKDTATMQGKISGGKLFYEPVEGGLDSNLYYAVSFYTLPDSAKLLGEQLNDMLYTDAQIYAWGIGAILADSGKVVKSGITEGREYKVLLSQNAGVTTIRKFAYGKRLYTLTVITDNRNLDNSSIRRFMESFKLK